jgi:hypothetical protein
MERESFLFYKSFYEAIRLLPREVQGEIYTAIMEYGLYGKETESLKPLARSIFTLVKPQLDANAVRYENGLKGGIHGNKGGAPKGNQNAKKDKNNPETTPKQPQNNPETTPNVNVNVNVNDNVCLHTHARTHEGDEIREKLLSSQIWIDQVRKTYHLTEDEVYDCVNAVVDYIVITSPMPTKSDAMRLFPKQVEIYKSTPKGSLEERKSKLEQEMRDANSMNYYTRDELREFYQYWTQTDSTGNKMLYESHQYWDTAKRMELWKQRKQA